MQQRLRMMNPTPNWTLSHLCPTPRCVKPGHVAWEPIAVNCHCYFSQGPRHSTRARKCPPACLQLGSKAGAKGYLKG